MILPASRVHGLKFTTTAYIFGRTLNAWAVTVSASVASLIHRRRWGLTASGCRCSDMTPPALLAGEIASQRQALQIKVAPAREQ
jgi:hypothetical protein